MTVDPDSLGKWLQVLTFLMAFVVGPIYTWIATRDKDNSKRIEAAESALENKIAQHASRIDKLETHALHGPTAKQMTELQVNVATLTANQDAFLRESNALRLAVDQLRGVINDLVAK